jgi:Protein kinase domain
VELRLRDAHDDLSSLMDFWRAVGPQAPSSNQPASTPPVVVIADRYVLGASIGQGGGGEVHRAVDRLSGDHLAIKLIDTPALKDLDRTRREINALRWLRLPGVVHMRDDGVDRDRYFIAMDLVEGLPFPGRAARRWESLAPLALDLLEVLARVHMAGVVHRDLKPGNVLVDQHGRPVLLDFGLAWGDAVVSGRNLPRAEGTPRYVAPEQLISQPTDQRADLYSTGVMLYEALAGRAPHGEGDAWEVLRCKVDLPAPPLRSVAPQVPRDVALVIDRLLERRPEDRPATAVDVIAQLGGRPPVASAIDLPVSAPRGASDLQGLFTGPPAFSHVAEDAAQALWLRTGGQVDRIAAELDGWVRSGLAHVVDGRLRIDRVALAQLEGGAPTGVSAAADPPLGPEQEAVLRWVRLAWPDATPAIVAQVSGMEATAVGAALQALFAARLCWPLPDGRIGTAPAVRLHIDDAAVRAARLHLAGHLPTGSEARVRQLVAAQADPQRLLPDVLATARPRVDLGLHSQAIALLELGLREARRVEDMPHEAVLLTLRVRVALEQEAPVALDRALYEVGRCEPRQPLHDALEGLLRAVRLVLVGERGRARRLADALPPFQDETLEVWRQAARVQAAYGLPLERQEELLSSLQEWADAGPQSRRAKLAGWWGNLRYKQGRYVEAAELHQMAARTKAGVLARVSSQINAATALLEVPELERARALATEAARHARRARHARYEARATWLLRAADYRADRAGPPQPELVEAAAAVAPPEEALLATTEAAIAWRRGELGLAEQLALRGARAFALRQTLEGELLCRALALAAAPPDGQVAALAIADRLGECRVPDVAVQVLGLLRFAVPSLEETWMAQLKDLISSREPVQHDRRLDVLSYSESLVPTNIR